MSNENRNRNERNNSILLSVAATIINNSRKKKMIKNVLRANETDKGIIDYQPSALEGYFDEKEELGNYIISGGINPFRIPGVTGTCIAAQRNGIPAMILHNGNIELSNKLQEVFKGTGILQVVDSQNPYYDPIYGHNESEIEQMLLRAIGIHNTVKNEAQYYIRAILSLFNAQKMPPNMDKLLSCPHERLLETIDKAVNGQLPGERLTEIDAGKIKSLLLQGQEERSNIEAYLSNLNIEGQNKFASVGDLKIAKNITKAFSQNKIIIIDTAGSGRTFLELVLCEYLLAVNHVMSSMLIIDDIPVVKDSFLEEIINQCGIKSRFALSSNDVYAMLNGNSTLFHSLVGKAAKVFIMRHLSGNSCEEMAKVIGKYDERSFADNMGGRYSFQPKYDYGFSSDINVSIKREYIIRPDRIFNMADEEVYIIDKDKNQRIHTEIVNCF